MMPRQTIHDDVLNRLGADICTGVYAAGTVLPPEPDLCELLGVSRIVVREAIKSLSARGLVVVRRRTGTLVQSPENWQLFDPKVVVWRASAGMVDEKYIADLMELRRVIEPAAARYAAQRASAEDIVAMRQHLEAMANAIDGKGEYVPADLAFHGAILDACHNQFLRQMQQAINVILEVSFDLCIQVPDGPAQSQPLHEALLAAIVARNPAQAEKAVLEIIERAENDLHASVKTSNGQQWS
ncbi:FadR/GntR family transcriptional regulator [Advenella mimigardefordensis]|uniref:Transcriptional regulator, GntR family n=1 Tax=Advenella mimigardefordensis (strain DSM 17166 / LMG 22922 / DPN7) TaxID=1247726 RepID=W0PFH0_ADVMD|nr:FadR/GntR family transcriptional regulator [Advenella mimigardefordensis]AHG65739.1 transcriptional regulator, GntR family [Advenella mimigardefordensis DPN7]